MRNVVNYDEARGIMERNINLSPLLYFTPYQEIFKTKKI